MASSQSASRRVRWLWIAVGSAIALIAVAFITRSRWLPLLELDEQSLEASATPGEHDHDVPNHEDHDHDEHDHDDHDHAAHADEGDNPNANNRASIELSENGLKNIGFEPFVVEPTDYQRALTLPAIVVERPGRSQIHIAAPLTGNVVEIYAVSGEAVAPGAALFEMRLTHEELVTAQRDFLASIATLDVVTRELERLQSLGEGVIAGKRIIEQNYEKQKLEAALRAEEQAMLLHGLSEEQVNEIRRTQKLFRDVTVYAPEHTDAEESCVGPHVFTVQTLSIAQGQQVEVGRELAVLSDHCELYVEGLAFEDDAEQIRAAAETGKKVTARLLKGNSPTAIVEGLEVLYVADQIDPTSRALKVYLRLPNEVALDRTTERNKRFLEWRYKPGQRMQLSIPVETWKNQLVLPTSAVVDEGAEAYVYRQNGDHFDQISVHLLNRDQNTVVIANDGALFKGDVIVGKGAFQMHLALKNKAGGGIDPHAGHNH